MMAPAPSPDPSMDVASVTPISIAGGYWTGASAIVDLLAEHDAAAIVPGEFMLFSFGQFFDEVTAPLLRGEGLQASGRQTLWRFREFNRVERLSFLRRSARRALASIGVFSTSLSVPRTGMSRALGADYEVACQNLLDAIEAAERGGFRLEESRLVALVQHVLSSAARGARPDRIGRATIGVFDQLVAPPYREAAEVAIPRLRTIMVDRDWRDQYLSMRPAYLRMGTVNRMLGVRPWDEPAGDSIPGFRDYFLWLRARIELERQRSLESARGSMLWLTFEGVVREPEEHAARVFDFLGIDGAGWRPGTCFHPERSRRRVGKWRAAALKGSAELREIEELGDLLGTPDVGVG